jgi:hypothetical protein
VIITNLRNNKEFMNFIKLIKEVNDDKSNDGKSNDDDEIKNFIRYLKTIKDDNYATVINKINNVDESDGNDLFIIYDSLDNFKEQINKFEEKKDEDGEGNKDKGGEKIEDKGGEGNEYKGNMKGGSKKLIEYFTDLKKNLVDVELPQYSLSHNPDKEVIVNFFLGKSKNGEKIDGSVHTTNENPMPYTAMIEKILFNLNLKEHIDLATKKKEDAELQNDKGGEENGVKEQKADIIGDETKENDTSATKRNKTIYRGEK